MEIILKEDVANLVIRMTSLQLSLDTVVIT
jgi:hypothetical protein